MEHFITLHASLFHYGMLVVFGVFVSAGFLGILKKKTDYTITAITCFILILVQAVLYLFFDVPFIQKLYPLVTHLPLALFFTIYYNRTLFCSLLSISITYFCCQIVHWIELIGIASDMPMVAVDLLSSILLLLLSFLLIRYFAEPFSELLQSSRRDLIIFSIVPFSYYIYYYLTAIYTDLLFQSHLLTVEFFPFIVCLAYLLFSILYFREYKNRIISDRQIQLAKMQLTQYESLQNRIEETRRANHDLKQHLRLIQAYIDQGDKEALKAYITRYGQMLPEDTGHRFCENPVADTVVRFYATKAMKDHICFESNLNLPTNLHIEEPDLCVLLGNLLENALEECYRHTPSECKIIIRGQMRGSRTLIITVDNSPANEPEIIKGVLTSSKDFEREGVGTLSIRNIAARYNGTADFHWKEDTFYASIVLILP